MIWLATPLRRVLLGGRHSQRIGVQREHVPRPQLDRRNAQDARAAAQVERVHCGPVREQVFGSDQAELGGGVGTGAEGHAGIDRQHDVVRAHVGDLAPFGADVQAAAQAHGMVVFFPGLGPVFVADGVEGRLGHGVELAHVPQRLAELLPGILGALVVGEVRPHDQPVGGRDLVRPDFDREAGLLDRHALVTITLQHVGHGLGGLAVHFDRDFDPVHPTAPAE